MERRVYPKPPIVEAVIEFRFAQGVEKTALLERLDQELGGSYSGERREKSQIEIQAQVQNDSVESSARRLPSITFLTSEDQLRLVGCSDEVLTVHVLAPYPGWESFMVQAREVVDALPSEVRGVSPRSIAVRYIDRIQLPDEPDESPNDYLTMLPGKPPSMPSVMTNYSSVFQVQSEDEDGKTVALVACSFTTDQSGCFIGLDLNLVRRDGLGPLSDGTWRQVVEDLHHRQRDIFEEAITDKMRRLFL
jgi:uncharacterized protein (TIGR04255 family)